MIVYAAWTLLFLGITIHGSFSTHAGAYNVRGRVYRYNVSLVIPTVTCYVKS